MAKNGTKRSKKSEQARKRPRRAPKRKVALPGATPEVVGNQGGARKSDAATVKEVKKETRKQIRRLRGNAIAQESMRPVDQTAVRVIGTVNRYALGEALFASLAPVLAVDDSTTAQSDVAKAFKWMMSNISNVEDLAVDSVPRVFYEIALGLRSVRIGDFVFVPDWSNVTSALDITWANYGVEYWQTGTADANGYYVTSATQASLAFTNAEAESFFAKYATVLDVVQCHVNPPRPADASAFAYQIDRPVSQATADSMTDTLDWWTCTNVSSTQYFLPCNATIGLEVPIKTHWLAALRLCTSMTATGNTYVRRPNHTISVFNSPSIVAWLQVKKETRNRKNAVIKYVDFTRFSQRFIDALEAIGTNGLASDTIRSNIGSDDMKWIAATLGKAQFRQYAGAYAGIYRGSLGSGDMLCGLSGVDPLLSTLRVIQSFNQAIEACLPYADDGIYIVPYITPITPVSLVISGSYNVTNAITLAFTSSPITYNGNYSRNANQYNVVTKYATVLTNASQCEKALSPIKRGHSMLDTTVFLSGSNVASIASRGPLTNGRFRNAIMNAQGIENTSASDIRRELYGQKNVMNFFGNQSLSNWYALDAKMDLVKAGTSIENIGQGTSPTDHGEDDPLPEPIPAPKGGSADGSWSSQPQQPQPESRPSESGSGQRDPHPRDVDEFEMVPQHPHGLRAKLASYVLPTYGNYGGPMFTAGSRDPKDWDKYWDKRSKSYVIPPVDEEDAAYKLHDERYHSNPQATAEEVQAYDKELVDSLGHLASRRSLSPYGYLARELFKFLHSKREKDEL